MNEELLALKWNNHQSTFLQIIKSLRYKNIYTDATLACNGKFFSVHKFVLSACSDYFDEMFYQAKSQNLVIVLKDIDCKHLEYLLDYMYVGEINVKQKELASLVSVAECLRIKGLAVPDKTSKLNASCSEESSTYKQDNEQIKKKSTENVSVNLRNKESFMKLSNGNKVAKTMLNDKPLHYNVKVEPLGMGIVEPEIEKEEILNFVDNNMNTTFDDEIQNNSSINENVGENFVKIFSNFGGPSQSFHGFQDKICEPNPFGVCTNEFSPRELSPEARPDIPLQFISSEDLISKNIGFKRFKRKYTELNHSNLGFRKKGNYLCPHCSYSCSDKSNFKRHVQVHTGEKPYHCPFCRYSCIHSSNLKTHIRSKHANDLGPTESAENSLSFNMQFKPGNNSHTIQTNSPPI